MLARISRPFSTALRGVLTAVGARWRLFTVVALSVWDIALFWFSANGTFGMEWGFAVTVSDLARFAALALVVATDFALWTHRRESAPPTAVFRHAGTNGGLLGALSGVPGLSTSACTVMGCGAPVIPVVGLAFVGPSSATLTWMAVGTSAVLGALLGVAYLGWRVGAAASPDAR